MKVRWVSILVPIATAAVCAAALAVWAYPSLEASQRQAYPAAITRWFELPPEARATRDPSEVDPADFAGPEIAWPGQFHAFDVPAASDSTEQPDSWPCFRGEYHDNVKVVGPSLLDSFGPAGPPVCWETDLGEGYAGAVVHNDRVYLLDYNADLQADMLRCWRLADGAELWRRWYGVPIARQHGRSRTTPAVNDDYVVTLGPKCHVLCVRAETGEFLWGLDLVRNYGTKVPPWYAGQCPLLQDDRAILAPGGTALLVAVDCETGRVLWETPNPAGWDMTHGSILPISFAGREIYIYAASGGLVGVDAETGEALFVNSDWQVKVANVPTPIELGSGDGRLLLVGGYGTGAMFVQLHQDGEQIVAESGARLSQSVLGSEQQTPIYCDGYVYAVLPKGVPNAEQLACLDARDGTTLWTSGRDDKFGLGPYVIADGKIFLLDDEGMLTVARVIPDGYQRLARAKVLPGHESWAPIAVAGGKLLVRDLTHMVCLDMRADKEVQP